MRAWVSLRTRADFGRTRRRGRRIEGRHTSAAVVPGAATQPVRAGIVTAKAVGPSVERNRARRRIRAALDRLVEGAHGDVVLTLRASAVRAPFAELLADVEAALRATRR